MPAWLSRLDTVTVLGAGLVIMGLLTVTLTVVIARLHARLDDARVRAATESRLHLDAEKELERVSAEADRCEQHRRNLAGRLECQQALTDAYRREYIDTLVDLADAENTARHLQGRLRANDLTVCLDQRGREAA